MDPVPCPTPTSPLRKLSGLFVSPYPPREQLRSALNRLGETSKLAEKVAENQTRGAGELVRWATLGRNAAIEDAVKTTEQLMTVFAKSQTRFAASFKEGISELHKMNESECTLSSMERRLDLLQDKENRLNRELKRTGPGGGFWKKGGDICLLKHQGEQATIRRQKAEIELEDARAEMEVVKMFRFRRGMQNLADAYRHLAKECTAIFDCHREIVELVPAISNQDVRHMNYDGADVSRRRVLRLRNELGLDDDPVAMVTTNQRRRRSEPVRRSRIPVGIPPPPYYCQQQQQQQATEMKYQNGANLNRRPSCKECGRLYPQLPPNPYVQQQQQQQQCKAHTP